MGAAPHKLAKAASLCSRVQMAPSGTDVQQPREYLEGTLASRARGTRKEAPVRAVGEARPRNDR